MQRNMSGFMPFRGGAGGRRHHNQWRSDGGRGNARFHRGSGRGRGLRGGRQYGPNLVTDLPLTELGTASDNSITFAIEGCCHGELDSIYERLHRYEQERGRKVDVLLCCGDFQSLRNASDYHSFAVPSKYRTLGSFCRYYSGEKVAPVLTLFVGGNHEASQPLQELYYGGWVAPKIYYLGAAGIVNVGGVRIGGISGIYKEHDYDLGRFEQPPYDNKSLRSIYHIRSLDVFRMKCLSPEARLDVMLSHDWPEGVERYGNTDDLLKRKPYFRNEVEQRSLGSPPNRELLETLQPNWWFAAHLHVSFSAVIDHSKIKHSGNESKPDALHDLIPSQARIAKKSLEKSKTAIGDSIFDDGHVDKSASVNKDGITRFQTLESPAICQTPDLTSMMTRFLSLDKCLPRRHCMSILHVPVEKRPDEIDLEYDVEWLSILRKTHHLTSPEKKQVHVPSDLTFVTTTEIEETNRLFQCGGATNLKIPSNFRMTVPPHSDPSFNGINLPSPLPMMGNPQTDMILSLLGLEHIITVPYDEVSEHVSLYGSFNDTNLRDDNEIDIDSDESGDATKVYIPEAGELRNQVDWDLEPAQLNIEDISFKKPKLGEG